MLEWLTNRSQAGAAGRTAPRIWKMLPARRSRVPTLEGGVRHTWQPNLSGPNGLLQAHAVRLYGGWCREMQVTERAIQRLSG